MLQPLPRGSQDRQVRYLKARNVQWFDLDTSNIDTMYASADEIDRYGVNLGDLLVCEGGEGGRCALATGTEDIEPCIIQNALHRARPRVKLGEESSLNDYLQYILSVVSSAGWFDVLNDKATIAHFTAEKFGALPIPMPAHAEQIAIARFLDHATGSIDRYIGAKKKLIALLEEQKQAVVHKAIAGRIDVRTGRPFLAYKPSGVEWLGDVPKHWEVRRTKSLFGLRTEKSGSAHGLELLSIYTHIGVRPRKDLEEKGNKASTTDDYWVVKQGDLIANKLLAWMGAIGVSHYSGVTSPAYDILMPIAELESDYFHHLFRTPTYLQQFKQYSRGIMDMRLRLYFDQFGRIPVAVPGVEEQRAIVDFCYKSTIGVSDKIHRATRQIDLLSEYRTRLIADVVTGKLDVREAAAELPDMNATACGNEIDTMQVGTNSHKTEPGFAEEAHA